jgi:UDP-glucose 4-epimerase
VTVLIVGGAGYIGSHMVRCLRDRAMRCAVLDNFSTGYRDAIHAADSLTEGNLASETHVARACRQGASAAMHFASFIQVGESVAQPGKYYANNVAATIGLLNALVANGVRRFIFSSSGAVYGEPRQPGPVAESYETAPHNPYGRTKLMVEQMLPDYERAYGLKWVALRYFNAAGAHPDATIGERHDPETHLIPLVLRAANGRLDHLSVYGTDYATPDGTCVRDYVHVCDLADAHLLALEYLDKGGESRAFNLGNGSGFSVRQVIDAAERVTGRKVPVKLGARRAGDPAVLVADASAAKSVLGWRPKHADLDTIVAHAWAWEQKLAAMTR